MTPPRKTRSAYPATWIAAFLVLLCAAVVLAATHFNTPSVRTDSATATVSAGADPQVPDAWLFP